MITNKSTNTSELGQADAYIKYHNVFVFSFDVVGYSEYRAHEQTEIQAQIDRCLEFAVPDKPDFVGYNDEGDGGFVLLQDTNLPSERSSALTCLSKFHSKVVQCQSNFSPPLKMRYALHEGRIVARKRPLGGTAFAGNAINESRRLVSSMPNSKPDQILCSSQHYKTLLEEVGLSSKLFYGLPPFPDKHGNLYYSYSFYEQGLGFDWETFSAEEAEERKAHEEIQNKRSFKREAIRRIRNHHKYVERAAAIIWFILVVGYASKFVY